MIKALLLSFLMWGTALGGLAYDLMSPVTKVYSGSSCGSGVLLKDDVLLTNAHVVEDRKEVLVKIFVWEDERKIIGTIDVNGVVLRIDKGKDLALVQLDCYTEGEVELGTEEGLEILTPIMHVGAPFYEDIQIFRGVVTDQDWHGLIQTDAFVQPGCSGGALWVQQDGKWKLLGVLTGAFRDTGISFFIPVSTIREFLVDKVS